MSHDPEDDEDDVEWVPEPVLGQASSDAEEHDHPAAWLYVPDLSERSGWATHSVPKRKPDRPKRRIGFGRE